MEAKKMPKYIESATAAEVVSKKHNIPLADLLDTFAEIPAADVAPIVHGQWIVDCEGCYYPYCSECQHEPKELSNYCPNCGAKMDGDKNE